MSVEQPPTPPWAHRIARASVEVVLIVLGVLIAFQVEEWGAELEAEERAIAQLESLAADFESNLARLDTVLGRQERVVRAQTALLEIAHGQAPTPESDSLQILTGWSYQFFRLEPITGAYDAMVSSGDLRRVRDPGLRADLAAFFGHVTQPFEDAPLSDLVRVELFKAVDDTSDMLAISRPGFRQGFPPSSVDPNYEALLSDPEFRSLLAVLTFIERNQRSNLRRIEADALRILTLLNQYVEEADR